MQHVDGDCMSRFPAETFLLGTKQRSYHSSHLVSSELTSSDLAAVGRSHGKLQRRFAAAHEPGGRRGRATNRGALGFGRNEVTRDEVR